MKLEKPTLRYGVLHSGYIFQEPLCFPEGTVLVLGAPFLQKEGKPKRLLLPVLRYDRDHKDVEGEMSRRYVDALPSTVVVCSHLGEAVSKAAVKAYSSISKKLRTGT